MPLVEQKLLALAEHFSSLPVFSRVRIARSVVFCVRFVDRYLSSFSATVLSVTLVYCLSLWYPQTFLSKNVDVKFCTHGAFLESL